MSSADDGPHLLQRQVGTFGAVMLGLGSIIGTGVFVSIGVAAGVAGIMLLPAIAVAAALATCNALNSAQLAASHPVSGGTYEYGYRYLHPRFGFTAGWMFLCAKSASAATAALGLAGAMIGLLDIDGRAFVPLAAVMVAAVTALVLSGIRRSSAANVAIVSVTLLSLLAFVIVLAPRAIDGATFDFGDMFHGVDLSPITALLYGSALMFVAYTGYGRIATLGEEVTEPKRTIPQAIIITLIVSAALYMAVGAVALGMVGPQRLAELTEETAAPLQMIAREFSATNASAVGVALMWTVAVGAVTALLGVLLNLVLGLSRVVLAMGRRGDLPAATARLNAERTTPYVAVIVVGTAILGLTLIGNVRLTWTFSAFTVLVYYAITNAAALRLPREERLYHPSIAWLGLIGCLSLAFFVPWRIWLIGLALIAAGLIWQEIVKRAQP